MTVPRLVLIPAGAGSGKTYRIQTQLAEWVTGGEVAPDRILAVTFTNAAAAELKERIRFELVRRKRILEALRLEESYISTIHAFGLRLLTEFAFEGGISPSPRLLTDDEADFLIRKALPRTGKAEIVAANLRKFGYRYDPTTGETAEEIYRATLNGLIGRLRSLGRTDADPRLPKAAVAMLRHLYGPAKNADALNEALHDAVTRLLKRFPGDLSPGFAGNQAAVRAFHNNFGALRRAEKIEEIGSDLELWKELRSLRKSMRGSPTPPGYDGLADGVIEAAAMLCRHPGPLKDAEIHVEALLGASQDCLGRYGKEKRKHRLVDYPDMLAGSFDILAKRRDVLELFRGRIDCLVIDEFQDTNPLQFALLWLIFDTGAPGMIVGDVKQSIMGFQNADPRLFEVLRKEHPEAVNPLTANWRSTAKLMEWVNAVGTGLFGGAYTPLEPKAGIKSALSPLEAIEAAKHPRSNLARASWTAVRIKGLLADRQTKVWDREAGAARKIRGGDVAVLCPTNDMVETYAEVLRTLGILSRIEKGGWFGSPEVRIARHALAYVADADDRHAALYLAVTELGSHTLESALKCFRAGEPLSDPVLGLLAPLREGAREKTVETLVADVINAVDLYGKAALWPDGAQVRANLLRLQAEAGQFREATRQVLLSGGYYGTGLKTFLSWLAASAEVSDSQPQPRVIDEGAVTVTTWHSAKGLEWPVVAVCGLHRDVKPRLPEISVEYDDFSDLSMVLLKARIEITPSFAAEETNEAFREPLQAALEEEAKRVLYVALTRAREKLILEWPSHLLKGTDRSTCWSILTGTAGMELTEKSMTVGGKPYPCLVHDAGTEVALEVEEAEGEPNPPLPLIGRRAVEYRPLPADLTPDIVAPSSLRGEEGAAAVTGLTGETCGKPLEGIVEVTGIDRGLLLHRAFEILGGCADRTDLLQRTTGTTLSAATLRRIGEAVSDFDRWLGKRFIPVSVRRELPILGLDEKGSVISGTLDLLVETAEGYWILDHKTDAADDATARFSVYCPQLACYAKAIRMAFPDKPVLGTGIHWISSGAVTLAPEGGAA
ncbi:MAG TPA: UvrD-helicase domain-containing protein [Candidatus Deferrimicrobiaceae bacterium]|nr:UvrD-helicase domain-containing protein [Candidatus Deferrimicrobiaceae bacterium]